ncbi:MAG TPA: DUF167 domain-containing protein [Thermodesulfobacteriota bacterium]|nr:DUF167 domain-containing protein [Thermodesulfobacteriota bacterium]
MKLSKTTPLDIRANESGVTFPVIVQPRSKKNGVVGFSEGALRVKVTAPPVEGAANEAVIELLSQTLRIKKSNIAILKMKTSRRKLIQCKGVSMNEMKSFISHIEPLSSC